MPLSPEAALQSRSSRYQSFKKKNKKPRIWMRILSICEQRSGPWRSEIPFQLPRHGALISAVPQGLRQPPALSWSPTANDISGWSTRFWHESAPTAMTSLLLYILQHPYICWANLFLMSTTSQVDIARRMEKQELNGSHHLTTHIVPERPHPYNAVALTVDLSLCCPRKRTRGSSSLVPCFL